MGKGREVQRMRCVRGINLFGCLVLRVCVCVCLCVYDCVCLCVWVPVSVHVYMCVQVCV